MHGEEEYLECIYKIQEEEGMRAKTQTIASRLGVKQASVTGMLLKLSRKGLITYEEYHGAILTERGKRIGRAMTRKHRILEVFLLSKLRIERARVHREACKLEHALSDEVEHELIRFLKKPLTCPDDQKPIPYS